MKLLQHPNVTSLLGVCSKTPPLKMILEFQSGGALDNYIETHPPFTDEEMFLVLHQVACGMAALHDHNVIHR